MLVDGPDLAWKCPEGNLVQSIHISVLWDKDASPNHESWLLECSRVCSKDGLQ